VAFEHGSDDIPVWDGEGEHVERRVHHLAADAVDGLLVEALLRVPDARVQALVPPGDALVGLGVVETVAGDAQSAHGDRERVRQDEPVTGLVLPVVLDPWCSRAEPALQTLEHLFGFDDVGVTREVAHRPQYSSPAARGVNGAE
jgi:hypothetical protein